jgi:hypothetical protein
MKNNVRSLISFHITYIAQLFWFIWAWCLGFCVTGARTADVDNTTGIWAVKKNRNNVIRNIIECSILNRKDRCIKHQSLLPSTVTHILKPFSYWNGHSFLWNHERWCYFMMHWIMLYNLSTDLEFWPPNQCMTTWTLYRYFLLYVISF